MQDSRPQTTGTERPPEKKPSKPQVPPPCPPKRRKADVFQLSKYTHVDDYSLNVNTSFLSNDFDITNKIDSNNSATPFVYIVIFQ